MHRRRIAVEHRVDDRAIGGERTHRIRTRRIARERESLTAAAAEIDVLARTAAARLLHPLVAAEGAEGARLLPDPADAVLAHVVEAERRDLRRGVTGHRASVGGDHEIEISPPTLTRLGELAVIVREHVDDLHLPAIFFHRAIHNPFRALDLRARRHQRFAVQHGPAVVLRVRELDAVGAELAREVDDLFEMVEIRAVEHDVHGEGEVELLDPLGGLELRVPAARARDLFRNLLLRILNRDLHVLEPRLLQRDRALAREAERRRHQRLIETERVRVGDELLEIATDERLAAGESELQRAKLTRLREDALPVIRRQLGLRAREVDRIRAVRAMQRAAVRELREQRRGSAIHRAPVAEKRRDPPKRAPCASLLAG